MYDIKKTIQENRAILGIELGSTRIKAVLIGEHNEPIASGGFAWENKLIDGVWTYSLEDVWQGMQQCYQSLVADVKKKYDTEIKSLAAIGISGMMHGYLVFDKDGNQLAPFRTWRNTMTGAAASELTELFQYNIPQRWSIAHLYQSILNGEKHVQAIDYMTTLAGYVHQKLTGERVVGVGEASGIFPIDSKTKNFNTHMMGLFENLIQGKGVSIKLSDILPKCVTAGECAGVLTPEGAKLLDPSGVLLPGIPMCPPEGDAGTGMVATNSIKVRTGNVSAGTSVFAMLVLEKELSKVYPEVDLVTTPAGDLVAMVHCNNCTSDLDAWASLFREFAQAMGMTGVEMSKVYDTLFEKALEGETDCGGILSYNYHSGEHITGFEEGRPLLVRKPGGLFNLANFMRVHIFTTIGALKLGLDILFKKENVKLDMLLCHGGLFITPKVGQMVMASAVGAPTCVMETAGEGGAWGIALLASYRANKRLDETLSEYLDERIFSKEKGMMISPDPEMSKSFEQFITRYEKGLAIERSAVENLL